MKNMQRTSDVLVNSENKCRETRRSYKKKGWENIGSEAVELLVKIMNKLWKDEVILEGILIVLEYEKNKGEGYWLYVQSWRYNKKL